MRPALLVSLVLFFLLIEAHGIRLEQGFGSVRHQRIHEEKKSKLIEIFEADGGGSGVGEVVLCRDVQCSGRTRKLMTKTTSTSTTTTTSKSEKSGGTKVDPTSKRQSDEGFDGNKENFSVKSSPVSEHREIVPERYPDIIDIAGMDYSPAKRKPPIHN